MDNGAADVYFDVDVHGPAPIPAWVDGAELAVAPGIGPLNPAQKGVLVRGSCIASGRPTGTRALEPRIDAPGVAVPDVDGRAFDRLAGRGIHHGEPQCERHAGPVLDDVFA